MVIFLFEVLLESKDVLETCINKHTLRHIYYDGDISNPDTIETD